MGFEVVGYDVEGNEILGDEMTGEVMGAGARRHQRMMRIPPKPGWRNQLAPGVIQPDEGMVPLPMTPQGGQKPFRAERLLVSVVRTGTDATGRLLTQLFVGTDLQGAEIAGWDAELIGQANSFGTRLTCKAAEPGVQIRLIITLSNTMTITTSSIFATFVWLGRVVH